MTPVTETKKPVYVALASGASLRVALSEHDRGNLKYALESGADWIGLPCDDGGTALLNVDHIVRIDLPTDD